MEDTILLSILIIIGVITGVIYARIAGYIGSILHFSDIVKIIIKLIQRFIAKINGTT